MKLEPFEVDAFVAVTRGFLTQMWPKTPRDDQKRGKKHFLGGFGGVFGHFWGF